MPAVPSPSCTRPGVRRNARSSLDSRCGRVDVPAFRSWASCTPVYFRIIPLIPIVSIDRIKKKKSSVQIA